MYSKKVMQYFLHPKNMGKIENADGVGKVGNPICLPPTERIHKNSESVEISKLKENDRILTHAGTYEKIREKASRKHNGKIITLKNKLGKINLTPEHLVYAIKVPKKQKFLRNKGKKQLIPSWYHSNHLEKGDLILYPILKKEESIKHIEIDIPKPKWDFRSKKIPNKIPLDLELLRLFGYFISEGNIQDKPCKTYISFTLNIKEKGIVEDIKKISKNLFGLDIKIKELPKTKTTILFLYNAQLARFFKKLFGNGAASKKLPDFIMNLSTKKQKALLYSLWKGDGYINLNRNGPRAGYATISYQLAQQIKILLLKQKIVPSIYMEKEKEVRGVKHKRAYRIHVGQRDSLIKLCKILNIKYKPKSYEQISSWFDNNYLYTPITNKKIFDYSGDVHNLEVNDAHSFVSEAFCLHNCGDVMYMYIKVKKEKNKEIISDIKFQTLGCGAAIATSSVITEMAKGKTPEQAAKISNKDVAKKLGGLPPIKMHCSNLAADALREAIKDYKKKKEKVKARRNKPKKGNE